MAKHNIPALPKAITELIEQIREANRDELEEAQELLVKFHKDWVVDGTGGKLPGLKNPCLIDVDTADQILEAIKIRLDNQ